MPVPSGSTWWTLPLGIIAPAEQMLHVIAKLDTCTPVHELHIAFKIPCTYDCITKLCRTQAEVILNRVHPNVCDIGQGEARHGRYKRLKLGGSQAYSHSAD
jgi:hypothetical protein